MTPMASGDLPMTISLTTVALYLQFTPNATSIGAEDVTLTTNHGPNLKSPLVYGSP